MDWRRKHRSRLREVLLLRILKQQIIFDGSLQMQVFKSNPNRKANNCTQRQKTTTERRLQRQTKLCPLPYTTRRYTFSVKHTSTQKLLQITLQLFTKTQFKKSNANRKANNCTQRQEDCNGKKTASAKNVQMCWLPFSQKLNSSKFVLDKKKQRPQKDVVSCRIDYFKSSRRSSSSLRKSVNLASFAFSFSTKFCGALDKKP